MASDPLFSPLTIKNITLPNRFVMPGMQRHWCEGGRPLDRMADYYRRRVEGGVSLVIGESSAVDHPAATQQPTAAHAFGPALEGWKTCIDAVHGAGGHMFLQLWHEGAVRKENAGGLHPAARSVSPSGLVRAGVENGVAATADDLAAIKAAFVQGAVSARAIGADGIEIHACHGYLLDLFLWAQTNRRDDGYGGDDIAARVRFPAEIVAAIRAAVGPDFIVSFRFSQWKEVDFEAQIVETPDDLATMLRLLRQAGVDLFHVSTRRFNTAEWPGSPLGLAGWTKKLTDAPVITVGSVGLDTDLMTNLFGEIASPTGAAGLGELRRRFENGEFDLVSVGRALIGDPGWVGKVRAGRFHELKPFRREDMTDGTEWEMDFVLDAHDKLAS